MKTSKYGMTPAQIHKAVHGETKTKEEPASLISSKKRHKPQQLQRKTASHDASLLFDLPWTTREAVEMPVPPWFVPTQKAEVSIIVPLFRNNAENFIGSLDMNAEGVRIEVIFVDDNCPLDSKSKVMSSFKQKTPVGRMYQSERTQGWNACCNIGAEKATGDILVFMHPSVKFEAGWLRPLVRMLKKPEIGAVAGLQIEGDLVLHGGSEWSWEQNRFLTIGVETYRHKPIQRFNINNMPDDMFGVRECESVSSYCMAVRRKDFLDMGCFNPRIQDPEWADADFCCMLKERGMKVFVQPACPVYLTQQERKKEPEGRSCFLNQWTVSGRMDKFIEKKRITPTVDAILVRRRAAHGDVLIAASVASALKKKHPNARIVFSTLCPEILRNNPWIDRVQEVPSERQFQQYIDLDMAYEYRPNTNILDSYAEAAGVDPKDCQLFLDQDPIEVPENYVVVHAGKTMWAGRNWSPFKFDAISKRLKEKGHKVVVVGTMSDHVTSVCDLDLRGKTSVHQLAFVIKNSKHFIGIDSFPMHVAQTFDVNGTVFFGSVVPKTRILKNNMVPVVANGLKCLGCHHKKPAPCTVTNFCEVGIQDCVNNVSVDSFWKQVESRLQ